MRTIIGSSLLVALTFVLCYAVYHTVAGIISWNKEHIIYYLIRRGTVVYICRSKDWLRKHKQAGDRIEPRVVHVSQVNWP